MPFPPEYYLIGAQKSGTTTLAYLLSQHPNVCVSNPKEPQFFTYNWNKGLAWYQHKFSNYKDAVCIDASTTYSMAPLTAKTNSRNCQKCFQDVPEKIYSVNPSAKFIYLLRDPVERTYSGYWHNYTRGLEQKSFGKAIKEDSFYLDVSDYYGQVVLWLKYFPIESFLFILFEDMKKAPERVAKDCFKFIGVESEDIQTRLTEARYRSSHVNVVGRQFNRLFSYLDYFGLHTPSFLSFISVRKFIRELTTNSERPIPKMREQERIFLCEYFSEKKHKLELLSKLSLNQWQA